MGGGGNDGGEFSLVILLRFDFYVESNAEARLN